MSSNNRQNIRQSIGTNSGSVQNIVVARDANISQSLQSVEQRPASLQDFLRSLEEVGQIIGNSKLSTEQTKETLEYIESAQREAKKNKPRKKLVLGNLEAAFSLLKDLSKTTDAAKEVVEKLSEPTIQLAKWLGIAVSALWT